MAKVAKNTNLHQAKRDKKDEFYTQLSDIENELKHYKKHFQDKVIFCNCDDPLVSNFFKYFFLNFKYLGLKELITTCYKSQNIMQISKEDSSTKAVCLKITKDNLSAIESSLSLSLSKHYKQNKKTTDTFDKNKDVFSQYLQILRADETFIKSKGENTLFDCYKSEIQEDKDSQNAGDFRSKDCIELLKQADIVVTNPPFSLFREYVAQLIEYDKKFVIIMPLNAITYKEIFKHIKDNNLWLGYGFKAGNAFFKVNDNREFAKGVYDEKTGLVKFRNVTWATNLDIKKRHEILETIYSYYKTPEKYPKYDNYDAINVDKTIEIPMDYEGAMGVPITFLDKFNPEQFEILGLDDHRVEWRGRGPDLNGKAIYRRIIIRNLNPKKPK